jgi:hypothetical protein
MWERESLYVFRSRGGDRRYSTEELTPDEQVEASPFLRELVVRALLGDDSVLHKDDLVGSLECRQSVQMRRKWSAGVQATEQPQEGTSYRCAIRMVVSCCV